MVSSWLSEEFAEGGGEVGGGAGEAAVVADDLVGREGAAVDGDEFLAGEDFRWEAGVEGRVRRLFWDVLGKGGGGRQQCCDGQRPHLG